MGIGCGIGHQWVYPCFRAFKRANSELLTEIGCPGKLLSKYRRGENNNTLSPPLGNRSLSNVHFIRRIAGIEPAYSVWKTAALPSKLYPHNEGCPGRSLSVLYLVLIASLGSGINPCQVSGYHITDFSRVHRNHMCPRCSPL